MRRRGELASQVGAVLTRAAFNAARLDPRIPSAAQLVRTKTRFVLTAQAFTFLLVAPAWAQTVPVSRLGDAESSFRHAFTKVDGVRELSDGRLLIVDGQDRRVLLASPDWSDAVVVGREGLGPGEYVLPTSIFPLVGDSSAIVDGGTRRLVLIDPEGGTRAMEQPAGAPCPRSLPTHTVALDSWARVYVRVPAVHPDSDAIVRVIPGGCEPDTVAIIPARVTGGRLLQRRVRVGGTVPPPYSASVQWAAASDGRVAIAYPEPYHVVSVDPRDGPHKGSAVPYEPIRLTEAYKQSWRDEQRRPRLVNAMRLDGSAEPGARYMRVPPLPEPAQWPAFLPPFLEGALVFAPDGTLWIRRVTAPDAEPRFDLFDESGQIMRSVQLPAGRHLVGLGVHWIYAVRRDELDLEYLERYRYPAPLR